MQITIDHKSTGPREKTFLINRGVPEHLFTTRIDLRHYVGRCSFDTESKPIVLDVKTQLNYFSDLIKNPTKKPYTLFIGSVHNDRLAQVVALAIFRKAMSKYIVNMREMGSKTQPYWHIVYGGFNDSLRDNLKDGYKAMVGIPTMLVLDNLVKNSTPSKVEKFRDLLYTFAKVPRIVICSGSNPLQVAREMLYMEPSYMINLVRKEA